MTRTICIYVKLVFLINICVQVMDAEGLLGVKVKSMQAVTVSYVSLLDWIRRVFADPVQRSSLRFGLEDVGDNEVYIHVSLH